MDKEEFRVWQDCVMEYSHTLSNLVRDRKLLADSIESHLSEFFDFDSIDVDGGFNKITLELYDGGDGLTLPKNIDEIGMEFTIRTGYDHLIIELYPFGRDESS